MLPFAFAMTPGLRHLRYFAAVAEAGQVTAVARRLYISQPAMSLALSQLELAIGAPLLRRHPGGVNLTEFGEQFLADAKGALALVAAAWTRRVPPDVRRGGH
jgi:DNA-binding transcriptional LysR family regulator